MKQISIIPEVIAIAERLVFSNDGLIFVTRDHYETFAEIIGEEK